jgi:integrase/recombinase XerD
MNKNKVKKGEKGKAKVLSKNEWNRLVKYQRTTPNGLRNVLLLHLSFFLGLRSIEMSLLMIGDLVDVNGDLKEECTLKKFQVKGGKKQRRFYLTNIKMKQVLVEYLATRKDMNGNLNPDAPLIMNTRSGSFDSDGIQQVFRIMFKNVGIAGASSHSGRRSFATHMSEGGVSINNLQTLMGHSSISTTALYINQNPAILSKITADYSL